VCGLADVAERWVKGCRVGSCRTALDRTSRGWSKYVITAVAWITMSHFSVVAGFGW